jgi:hypothetical protein
MKHFTRCVLTVLFALTAISIANADLNSERRVRAFAKLPDWSGLWAQFSAGSSGFPEDPLELKAFLEALAAHPPYNAEWEAKSRALRIRRASQPEKPHCLWGFPPLLIGSPFIFQAIVTPEETTLIFSNRETRHIYTDGRTHPSKDELFATPWGDSVGHWEGQTLVVDTVATSSPANSDDDPLSEQARYTERIRMLNENTLEDQMTVEDPVALSRPWQLTRQYHRDPSIDRIIDQVCEENDRNPVVNGKMTIAPPKR